MIDELSFLTTYEAAQLLRSMATAIRTEVRQLPEPALAWHPAVGEWCIKEVLGHLAEAERRGFAGRIRIVLASDQPQLEEWDQAAVERERHDCERQTIELLDEFETLRTESVDLVSELRPVDLQRAGHHPKVGLLRVSDLLHEWVYHDHNHVRQMFANVQAFVWPHLGNGQRFYTG